MTAARLIGDLHRIDATAAWGSGAEPLPRGPSGHPSGQPSGHPTGRSPGRRADGPRPATGERATAGAEGRSAPVSGGSAGSRRDRQQRPPAPSPESRWDRSAPGLTPEQLRELYDAHGQAVYEYVWRACHDTGTAEDVVQEAFVRAWQRAPLLDPGRPSLRSWLFVVSRHILIDTLRARSARPAEIATDSLPDRVGRGDVEDRAVDSWQMASSLRLLSGLHREVLVQLYYLDRTVAQAAVVLGVPAGTVKSRAYYALRALKVALADLGVTS
jgi:RNA polymerase sigma-70 factor (ECF subfamily)